MAEHLDKFMPIFYYANMQTQTIRTSVDLQADLMIQLRYLSVDSGMSIKQILHQAAADYLASRKISDKISADKIIRQIRAMSKIGKRNVNLTRAAIREREGLANANLDN